MKGSWFIGDHFLSIRPWEPFFKPSSANVALIAVWIRLYELPIELYEAEVLKEIVESIGKVLRIDSHTAMEARGKYARVCIQIDVNKPLVNTICIGRFEQTMSYEGIHSLCFSCGRLGHRVEGCPYTIRKEKEPLNPLEEVQDTGSDTARDGHVAQSSSPVHSVVDSGEATKEDGSYRPWMVVSKRTYGRKGTTLGTGTDSTRKSTWQPPLHLPPRNPEWLNTLSSGPTGNQSEPCIDGGFHWKVTEKWAAKPNGSVGNSSSGPAHSSIEKVKAIVNSSGQVRSKSPNQISQGLGNWRLQ